MSGKRILDAMALLRASRNVAAKHFDIRLSQADMYTKTSSIFKAARTQTSPAFAAAAQSFSQSVAQAAKASGPNDHIPHQDSSPGTVSGSEREGLQDHFYKRSGDNAAVDPVPKDELDITQKQAEREPLPDGTIPASGSLIGTEKGDAETFNQRPTCEEGQHPTQDEGQHLKVRGSNQSTIPGPSVAKPMGSEQVMKAQRQSEDQIPSETADPPSPEDDFNPGYSVEQEQDIFYQPPEATSPVLSALPRRKVPKIENDVQAGDSHIPEGINADVYYSGNQAVEDGNDAQEPSEKELSQIFSNPRIARMLGKKGKYVPDGVRSFHTSTLARQHNTDAEKEDIKKLAADMARDVEQGKVRPKFHTLMGSKLIKLTAFYVG